MRFRLRLRLKLRGRAVRWIVVGLFSILAAPSRVAGAADADELIREGVALRRSGDDLAALRRFEQAFQIQQSPRAMAQIGLAEQALGRWAMAYEHLHRALDAASDPWVKKSQAAISEALNRVNDHVGQLEIFGGSPDAEVRINGQSRGKLPLAHPMAVSTGTVTIDLAASGFVSVQRTTVVRPHETVRESFDALTPLPARNKPSTPIAVAAETPSVFGNPSAEASAAATPSLAAAARRDPSEQQVAPTGSEKTTQDQGSSKAGSFRTKAKWVVWGVGVVALGVGVFGGIRQNQAGNDFASGCGIDAGQNVVMLPGSTKTAADCRSLKTQVDSNYRLELGGLVGAGVLAATGLVLWLTEPSAEPEKTALACSPGMTIGRGPWVACRIAF